MTNCFCMRKNGVVLKKAIFKDEQVSKRENHLKNWKLCEKMNYFQQGMGLFNQITGGGGGGGYNGGGYNGGGYNGGGYNGGGMGGGFNPLAMFSQFDRNGDGSITEDGLREFLQIINSKNNIIKF